MLLFGIFIILLILILWQSSKDDDDCNDDIDEGEMERFLINYPITVVPKGYGTYGSPPPLGDFLPTDGNVNTGDGGKYELESDGPVTAGDGGVDVAGPSDSVLCDACMSHCIDYSLKTGRITHAGEGHPVCSQYCRGEC